MSRYKGYQHKRKYSVCNICYNEQEFLYYAIKAVYNFAHEIIILEGAIDEFNPKLPKEHSGISTDGTNKILKRLKKEDKENKIKVIQKRWKDEFKKRNEYLEHVTGDWIFMVDSDEIYTADQLEYISYILEQEASKVETGRIHGRNFWKDFYHYYDSGPMYRLFKYEKGARYCQRNLLKHAPDGPYKGKPYDHMIAHGKIQHKGIHDKVITLHPNSIMTFHYSRVHSDSKMKQKLQMVQKLRGVQPNWFEKVWEGVEENPNILVQYGHSEFKVHPYGRRFDLYDYEGNHPPILDDHPYRRVRKFGKINEILKCKRGKKK